MKAIFAIVGVIFLLFGLIGVMVTLGSPNMGGGPWGIVFALFSVLVGVVWLWGSTKY